MSDLISRSALIEAMEKKYEVAEKKGLYAVGLDCGFIITEQIIKEQPTVDAVPVVRGEWVGIEYDMFFKCSRCGHTTDYMLTNFCPNCGADMRKKVK